MDTNISIYERYSSVPSETLSIGLRYLLQAFALSDNFHSVTTGACNSSPSPCPESPQNYFLVGCIRPSCVSVAERAKL